MLNRVFSAAIFILLLTSMLCLTFNIQPVRASGTIYIRADGSIDPPDAPISTVDNVTYVLTGNIISDSDGIAIERDNVVIDGNGFALQGSGTGYGFSLSRINNVTIRNTSISSFYYCIHLSSASHNIITRNNVTWGNIGGVDLDEDSNNNTVSDNHIYYNSFGVGLSGSSNMLSSNILTDNGDGIILSGSNNIILGNNITGNAGGVLCNYSTYSVLSENNVTDNRDRGIWLLYSSGIFVSKNNVIGNGQGIKVSESLNNTISENNIQGNGSGFKVLASSGNVLRNNSMAHNGRSFDVEGGYMNDVDASNKIEDKPVYYWINQQERVIPSDAGYVCLVNCTNIIAQGMNITNNGQGILLASTANSTIAENNLASNENGIELYRSSNNSLSENNITANDEIGIILNESSCNMIRRNRIETNSGGICFGWSSNNSVIENSIEHNYVGITLILSLYNLVYKNGIEANTYFGIRLSTSASNTIYRNILKANDGGIDLTLSSDNAIFNNNFVNNTKQVHDASWDHPEIWSPSVNAWDDGYRSGGNYWSDYTGVDLQNGPSQNQLGSDGIGDTAYAIDGNNTDYYPLMGIFTEFNASSEQHVQAICNSTISDFQFNGTAISFNVSGENGTTGFCRICIPTALMNGTYHVLVNGTEVSCNLLLCSNSTHNYLYFNYTHSTKEVIIIPEFPSLLILPLFITLAVFAAFVKRGTKRRESG